MKKHRIWLAESTGQDSLPVPPDLPLCAILRSGWSSFVGKGNIRRIYPDFGQRKKRVLGINICQRGLCQMRKILAGEKPASNCRQSPSNPRSAEIVCPQKLMSERRHRRRKRRFPVGKTAFSLRNYGLCA